MFIFVNRYKGEIIKKQTDKTPKSKGSKARMTPADVIHALWQHTGFVTYAAKELKTSVKTLYEYFEAFPEIKEALKDIREHRLDVAESALLQAIKKGNVTAIIFFLKTQGRERGYSQIDEALNQVLTEEQKKTLDELRKELAKQNQ